eukprot:5431710-Pleurochrysis_carterae.AAC.2
MGHDARGQALCHEHQTRKRDEHGRRPQGVNRQRQKIAAEIWGSRVGWVVSRGGCSGSRATVRALRARTARATLSAVGSQTSHLSPD